MEKVMDDVCNDVEIEEAWMTRRAKLLRNNSKQRYELVYRGLLQCVIG